MHGLGNDYVYVDAIGGPEIPDDVDLARLAVQLSDRHFGVGGDGLIIIGRGPSGRLRMRMFNSDGTEGEMCGNGMRCFAAYCFERGYTDGPRFEVDTPAGVITPEVNPSPDPSRRAESVTVDLGPPQEIRTGLCLQVPFPVPGSTYQGTYVSMGNPHFVVHTADVSSIELETVGPLLERHSFFANRANIEFVQLLDSTRLRMRVWERGSGITLACGTGAAAALVASVAAGISERRAVVLLDGGELIMEWPEEGSVLQTGPAEEVFNTVYTRPLPRLERP